MKPQNGNRKRVPFYRALLPWKGDSKKLIFYKTVSLLAVCVFLGCALYLFWDLVLLPAAADTEQQDIKSIYYAESSDAPDDSGDDSHASASVQEQTLSFENLRKINSSIVGWIKVPNTIIDLPVLQATEKDPEFYLTHDYRDRYSGYGSVFVDAHCSVENGKSRSIVLYGHSLNSGRMFTQLDRYKSLDFYKKTPVFTFDTADSPSQWKVISVFLTNTLPEQGKPFNYMKTEFKNDSDFLNFIYQMRIRSLYNTGVSVNKDDRIVLLSTCSYEFKDFREVVVARKVRDGESSEADVSKAFYNSKTVYPDCWYAKHGGKKPDWPETYEEAVKQNLLSWGEKE
ncbi:class B sortase [Caproiciproducens faecalis]|uniref:Class B sortase n=1 Tax=Caproiciproducens faecalis TaxID=2820301 RepID=A0ABS7DPW3_9FIRM|nr:class B sortase [Caproiciproducens faecalis]MBW7573092.1 class B sortase [Caproiciproducens faecalis]